MEKKKLIMKAYAKLNLTLKVLGKMPDGYHEIRTLFHSIDLTDILNLRELSTKESQRARIKLSTSPSIDIPKEENLIFKAARRILESASKDKKVEIKLEKHIPIGAGLGGGSSDAASTLVGLNELFKLGKSKSELKKIGAQIGVDVPYFIQGGLCWGKDRGEALTPITPLFEDYLFLLLKPPFSLSTEAVYHEWDRIKRNEVTNSTFEASDYKSSFASLTSPDRKEIMNMLGTNDLETCATKLCPRLSEYRNFLENSGADFWGMSGSGPTFYAAFKRSGAAKAKSVKKLASRKLEVDTYLTKPTNSGYKMEFKDD